VNKQLTTTICKDHFTQGSSQPLFLCVHDIQYFFAENPKKSWGKINFYFYCVYFLRRINNTPTAIATITAIPVPTTYVSVIGAGVASGGAVA